MLYVCVRGMLDVVFSVCIVTRGVAYSAGSGFNRVQVVLSGFSVRLFCFVQAKTLCRYGCMHFLTALLPAYAMTRTGVLGGGMSAVYMLNSVGERTPPCGTPILN